MADIKKYLNKIKNSLFGLDVRDSIHDGIDAVNKECEENVAQQNKLQSQFNQLVINAGNSNAEIVDARVKSDGTAYSKLGDRLDAVDSQLVHNTNVLSFPANFKSKMIAHRGYSSKAPENSIPAVELAGMFGFWGCEVDIKCTSDGKWYLMHDNTVDRTTNGTGTVEALTSEYIDTLTIDVGNNISNYPNLKVPTLSDFLSCCKKYELIPVIEIKSGLEYSNLEELLNLIYVYGFEKNCILMSFSADILIAIRELNKVAKLMFLINEEINTDAISIAKGVCNCGISTGTPTKEGIILAHKNNLFTNCWTVDVMSDAIMFQDFGVMSITSNKISEVER